MSAEAPPVCVDARNSRQGPRSRPGLLAPPTPPPRQGAERQMGSLRKLRGRARGSPRGRLRAGAGRGATGDARGPHLHVEQLGRLVHPDGDGALTQGFAEHFLEGIPHLIHPIRERQQRGSRQPRSLRGHRRPLTRHRDPSSRVRAPPRGWVSAKPMPPPALSPAPRTPVTPRKPRGQEACEKPRQGHPPPSPAGAASQSLALGAATGCQPQEPQGQGRCLLPFAEAQRGSAALGGTLLPSTGASGKVPKRDRREVSLQTFNRSLPGKPCTAGTRCGARSGRARVPGEAPAALPFSLLLSSREFLQSHIATAGPPQRESGVPAAPATVGARAPALCTPSQARPAPAVSSAVQPVLPTRTLARRHPSPHYRQLPHSH